MTGSEQRNIPILLLNILMRLASCVSFVIVMLLATNSRAGVGGSIYGTVKDASGAVVANATVTATNVDTGVRGQVVTNGSGFYVFPELSLGRYIIAIKKAGFKIYQRTTILLDTNSTFSIEGTAKRRFFHSPGMDNYDVALLKAIRLTESRAVQFRIEGFNVFNHAQFFGPQSVDGNIGSSTFGQVVSANPPRLVQLGAKFLF